MSLHLYFGRRLEDNNPSSKIFHSLIWFESFEVACLPSLEIISLKRNDILQNFCNKVSYVFLFETNFEQLEKFG